VPAITATFKADVAAFKTEVQGAVKTVTGFGVTTQQISRDLSRFGADFSGASLIRQFYSVAAVIEDVGGVSALTNKEVAKLAPTAADVAAKYRALGQSVPADLQKVITELQGVQQANESAAKAAKDLEDAQKRSAAVSQDALAGLKGIGTGIASAFSVGAVVAFGKGIVDSASQVHDLAEELGISTDSAQELKFAATQTGTSFEKVTGAIAKMASNLQQGTKQTETALSSLGLNLSNLQQSAPDEAFAQIAEAMRGVTDEQKQLALSKELFGKGGADALALIKEGYRDLAKQAHETGAVIDGETIKAIESAGDAWDQFVARSQGAVATAAVDLTRGLQASITQIEGAGVALSKLAVPQPLIDFLTNKHLLEIIPIIGPGAALANAAGIQPELPSGLLSQLLAGAVPGGGPGIAGILQLQQLGRNAAEVPAPKAPRSPNLFGPGGTLVSPQAGFQDQNDAAQIKLQEERYRALVEQVLKAGPAVANFAKQQREAIQVATELAARVEKLGGATKLTKDEQAELNRVMTLAVEVEKLHGLGASNAAKEFERLATASKLPIQPTRDLRDVITQLVYQPLPDLSHRTRDVENMLQGLQADGLIPVTRTFTDLSGKMDATANKGMPGLTASMEKVKVHAIDVTGSLEGISAAFQELDRVQPLEGTLATLAHMVDLMTVGSRVAGQFTGAFYNSQKTIVGYDAQGKAQYQGGLDFGALTGSKGSAATFTSYAALAQTAVGAYGAFATGTNIQGRGNRALQGAEIGAGIGANPVLVAATSGISIGAGAAIGALIGALRNPGFEQEIKRISKAFGTGISEELAKNIDHLADDVFHGNRQAAELYSTSDILQQAGGLKPSNIRNFTDRLHDVFSMVEGGQFSTAQAQDVLEKNFAAFGDYITKSKDIASKAFQDIVRLNHSMGVDAESITAFISQQAKTIGTDLASLAGPLEEQYGGIGDKIKATQQALADFDAANGGKSESDLGVEDSKTKADLTKQLNDLLGQQAGGAATAGEELNRLGVIALASFNAAVAGGEDFLSAVNDIGPGLDELIGLQRDLGITTDNAAISQLEHFRDLVNSNQSLVASAGALGEGLRALASIGGITTESLAAMEQQGGETFDRLVAAGFTENEALQQMKGFLLNVLQAHQQLGTPIDENTQRLIDQADKLGLLKDNDPTDALKTGFKDVVKAINDLTHALGVDVPNAAGEAGQAIRDRIPTHVPVDVDFNLGDLPDYPSRSAPPTAAGAIVWSPQRRLVGEAGPEVISPLRDLPRLLPKAAGSNQPIVIQNVTTLDGRVVARSVQKVWSQELRLSGAAR
jgi:hypothetical protein